MKSRQASVGLDVDLGRRGRLACCVHRLARPQQRLGRDARPVRALPADELALDQGDAQAALGQRPGAVLARRAPADHDHVVVAHVGSSSPASLAHHVLRVPVRPVLVRLTRPRLVLAVRRRRAPQRLRQLAGVVVRPSACRSAAGEARLDLLDQPAVAVRDR